MINNKLQIEDGFLPNPGMLTGSSDISCLPVLATMDIYNYLSNFGMYHMLTLRD